jgi:hypothetical protein
VLRALFFVNCFVFCVGVRATIGMRSRCHRGNVAAGRRATPGYALPRPVNRNLALLMVFFWRQRA